MPEDPKAELVGHSGEKVADEAGLVDNSCRSDDVVGGDSCGRGGKDISDGGHVVSADVFFVICEQILAEINGIMFSFMIFLNRSLLIHPLGDVSIEKWFVSRWMMSSLGYTWSKINTGLDEAPVAETQSTAVPLRDDSLKPRSGFGESDVETTFSFIWWENLKEVSSKL